MLPWLPTLSLPPPTPPPGPQAYGLHGLLLGAVISSKLARYACHGDLHARLEACRLAARLAAASFSAHAGHPQRPAGFAAYTPRQLWDGADTRQLWGDPYRCPVGDLVGGLETVVGVLLDSAMELEALPVLALWEHLVLYVTRSLQGAVLCRIMRVRALVALGFLSEASAVLLGLLAGAQLPDPVLDTHLVPRGEDGAPLPAAPPVPPLRNDALPGEPSNRATLTHLGEAALPPSLERLYGPWLCAHLDLARAGLLMRAGAVPNQWKATDWRTGERVVAAGGGGGLPEACEGALLDKAGTLLRRALVRGRRA